MKRIFKYGLSLLTLPFICLSFPNSANAVLLKGENSYFYHVSTGTVDPIFLNLGNGLVSTGNITYSLNLANPTDQTFSFNFDTKTIEVNVDYFLDFPLLKKLGQSPLKVSLVETGPIITEIPDLPVGKAQKLTFTATETGIGIAEPGSILSGLKYETSNRLIVNLLVDVNENGEFTPTANTYGSIELVDIVSKITLPQGIEQITTGTGYSRINPTPAQAIQVPESSSVFSNFLSIGILVITFYRLKPKC